MARETVDLQYGLEATRDESGDWYLWLRADPVLWSVPSLDGDRRQVHGSLGTCRQEAEGLLRRPQGYRVRGERPVVQIAVDGQRWVTRYRGETRCYVDLGEVGEKSKRVSKSRVFITVRPDGEESGSPLERRDDA